MARLFEDLSLPQLQRILARGRRDAPLAHLTDPAVRRRAVALARANGVWADLDRTFDPAAPVLALTHSMYRMYRRIGVRGVADDFMHGCRADASQAALALWLGHPKADLNRLQDLLWALCDMCTWVGPAHENSVVDLFVTDTGVALAEILHVLGDRLEPEVAARVRGELERRILNVRNDPTNWWRTSAHNWNHVCNGNIVRIGLELWPEEPAKLAPLVHRCVTDMQLALDGFTDDGGCVEGPGYWNYGFGHFVKAAYALHAFTGGRINLMTADAKTERICRYPLAVHIEADKHAPFADTAHGYLPAGIALLINRFFKLPELYTLCRLRPGRALALGDWNELGLYRGEKAPVLPAGDSLLPELGVARLRSIPGPHRLTVVATAGNNGVNHNHNDIGSFVAYRDGVELLTDPGAPVYNAQTFSPRRYEILFCNSLGHSVPLINGRQQAEGKAFRGAIAVDGLDTKADKSIAIDMTHAYPAGTVESLQRTLTVDYRRHTLGIADTYRFGRRPRKVIETFITCQGARVSAKGASVRIGRGRGAATLTAKEPGRFTVVVETGASKDSRTGQVVNRILFAPETLTTNMTLRFELL